MPPKTRKLVRATVGQCEEHCDHRSRKAFRSHAGRLCSNPVMKPETRVFGLAQLRRCTLRGAFIQPPWGWYGLLTGRSADAIAWLFRMQATLACGVVRVVSLQSFCCAAVVLWCLCCENFCVRRPAATWDLKGKGTVRTPLWSLHSVSSHYLPNAHCCNPEIKSSC